MKNDMYVLDNTLRITPVVQFLYPYLVKQDTKFDPKWCMTLVFEPKTNPEHKAYLKKLTDTNKTVGEELLGAITKGKNAFKIKDLVKPEEDSDGNITGRYLLKITTKEKPIVKDSAGNLLSDGVASKIGNGSKGRVCLSLKKSTVATQKTVGLTAYFTKVQVIEMVEYNGGTASDDPFGAVEGGFVAAPVASEGEDF